MGPRRVLAVVLLLVGLAAPARAQDDEDVGVRKLRFAERGRNLVVSGSFTDVFDAELLEQLSSGFTTNIVLRAYVYPKGEDALPVAFTAATFRVVYDLWEEEYVIQIRDMNGERNLVRGSRAEALKAVTVLHEFPVAPLKSVKIGPHHFVGVIVEVNPISEELLAEVRRWLARDSARDSVAGNSSFFGSFVSIFVNPKIPEADRILKFRSQYFYRVKR